MLFTHPLRYILSASYQSTFVSFIKFFTSQAFYTIGNSDVRVSKESLESRAVEIYPFTQAPISSSYRVVVAVPEGNTAPVVPFAEVILDDIILVTAVSELNNPVRFAQQFTS